MTRPGLVQRIGDLDAAVGLDAADYLIGIDADLRHANITIHAENLLTRERVDPEARMALVRVIGNHLTEVTVAAEFRPLRDPSLRVAGYYSVVGHLDGWGVTATASLSYDECLVLFPEELTP